MSKSCFLSILNALHGHGVVDFLGTSTAWGSDSRLKNLTAAATIFCLFSSTVDRAPLVGNRYNGITSTTCQYPPRPSLRLSGNRHGLCRRQGTNSPPFRWVDRSSRCRCESFLRAYLVSKPCKLIRIPYRLSQEHCGSSGLP